MTAEASGGGSQGISKSDDLYDKCREAGVLPVLKRHGLWWQERREGYSEMFGWAWEENGRTEVFPLTDALAEHVVCSIAQGMGAVRPFPLYVSEDPEGGWIVFNDPELIGISPEYPTRLDACIAMLRLVTDHVKTGEG